MIGHTFPLLEVTGSAYELGYQHGAQAAPLIERYLRLTERLTGKPRDVLCRNAMTLLPYMTALSPAFVEEVRGLAAGADIAFEEAVLCQARAEAGRVPEGGCTAFAVTGSATANGQTLAGQNQDLEAEYADVALLLKVKPTDGRPRALMFTFAGQHQMRDAAAGRSCLCITQGVAHSVNLFEVNAKAFANLLKQARQRFSALAVFIRRVWAVKNGVDAATRFGQGFVHFVVHLVQCGDIKQAAPQA
jgi:hypothetical protein